MDNLLKFIFVAVILMSNERLLVSGSSRSISASVGEDVTLNCSVDSHITPEHIEEVSWKKTDEDEDILVLLYQNHESLPDSSDEQYRDRVEFFTAEIPKGNFSLRLKSVRTEDKGVYMCQVFAGGLTANATVVLERLGFSVSHIMVLILCISAFGSALLLCCLIYCRSHNEGSNVHGPSGALVALQGCSVILPCYVNEKTEGLNVEWRKTDSGNQVYKYSYKDGKSEKSKDAQCDSHFFTDRIQHGNFSLHLDNLRPEDAGEYTCSVSAKINVKLSLLGPSSLPDSLRLHLFLVFCPNMIMFFAFVFWGVSEGSRREWVCKRGGAWKQRGLAACDEAHLNRMEPHHRRCLNAKRASPRETGLFPRACTLVSSWVQEGSVEGLPRHRRRELPNPRSGRKPHPWTVVGPGCRAVQVLPKAVEEEEEPPLG